jgi:hypothetical protein
VDDIYIIGGGPSVAETNLDLIKDKFVIGTNAAFRLGSWVDVCFFLDCRFYKWSQDDLEKWPNRIITTCPTLKGHPKIEVYKKCTVCGICHHKGYLAVPDQGKNAGATAIDLAIRMRAKRIILIGYDMKVKQGRHNYHNYHNHTPRDDVYNRFFVHFKKIKEELPKDIEIINATPDSALTLFPKLSLKEALQK